MSTVILHLLDGSFTCHFVDDQSLAVLSRPVNVSVVRSMLERKRNNYFFNVSVTWNDEFYDGTLNAQLLAWKLCY